MKNILRATGSDSIESEEEEERILNLLSNLGLSNYEAKAYMALIALKEGSAEEIASISEVPRTSIYKVMRGLENRDLVRSRATKPIRFVINNLEVVEEQIVSDIREGFSLLRRVEGLLSEGGTPQLVYTISGRQKVLDKIGELIDSSNKSLFVSSPEMKALRIDHGERFADAMKRGVEVILVMEPALKAPECTSVYRKEGLTITEVIVDDKSTLMATPGMELCGFTDNAFLTSHLKSVLRTEL